MVRKTFCDVCKEEVDFVPKKNFLASSSPDKLVGSEHDVCDDCLRTRSLHAIAKALKLSPGHKYFTIRVSSSFYNPKDVST